MQPTGAKNIERDKGPFISDGMGNLRPPRAESFLKSERDIEKAIHLLFSSRPEVRQLSATQLKAYAGSSPDAAELIRATARKIDTNVGSPWTIYRLENSVFKTPERKISPEKFQFINLLRQKIPLWAFHLTDIMPIRQPDGSYLMEARRHDDTIPTRKGPVYHTSPRGTFHFSINSVVSGKWGCRSLGLGVNLQELVHLNQTNLIGGNGGDFMFWGPVVIPASAIFVQGEKTNSASAAPQVSIFNEYNTREKAVSLLLQKVGVDGLWELHNWHNWKTSPEIEENFRGTLLSQGLHYGHHGSHWTLPFESVARCALGLQSRFSSYIRDFIVDFVTSGGSPEEVEILSSYFRFWKKDPAAPLSYFDPTNVDTIDLSVRPLLRILVEKSIEAPDKPYDWNEIWPLWLARIKEIVPPNEHTYFDEYAAYFLTRLKDKIHQYSPVHTENFLFEHFPAALIG